MTKSAIYANPGETAFQIVRGASFQEAVFECFFKNAFLQIREITSAFVRTVFLSISLILISKYRLIG